MGFVTGMIAVILVYVIGEDEKAVKRGNNISWLCSALEDSI